AAYVNYAAALSRSERWRGEVSKGLARHVKRAPEILKPAPTARSLLRGLICSIFASQTFCSLPSPFCPSTIEKKFECGQLDLIEFRNRHFRYGIASGHSRFRRPERPGEPRHRWANPRGRECGSEYVVLGGRRIDVAARRVRVST